MVNAMKYLDTLLVCCCAASLVNLCTAKRGFILTAPKAIDAGSTEYFTFTAFDVPPGGHVTLKLMHWYTGDLLAESTVNVLNNINQWVEMTIPPSSTDVRAKIQVQGTFSDGYSMEAVKEVHIRHNSVVTFVQTDKPIYKPGQTVKFRVLPMDNQLKPLDPNTMADIWIEDPSSIRVIQWKDVKFTEGIVQLEMPLSNEPTLGEWSIKSTINQALNTQKFKVQKYVLPTFEVKITAPPYLTEETNVMPIEVCAWYSYGKKVDGTVTLDLRFKRRYHEKIDPSELISGCRTFQVNMETLFNTRSLLGHLEIFAEVTENGTERMGNASTTVKTSPFNVKLEFMSFEGSTDFFKPGIPYFGELSVQRPDGTPAADEKVEICADYQSFLDDYPTRLNSGSTFSSQGKHCHLFTSNKKGRVHFTVPPKSSVIAKISLEAFCMEDEEVRNDPKWQWWNAYRRNKNDRKAEAFLDLTAWYSSSNSYLQIQYHSEKMECDKLYRVNVRYNAEKDTGIKFYHQVLSRGRIVQQGSHQRTFFSKEEDPVRYDLGDADSSDELNSTIIGEFLLSFEPKATMSPTARLLVFYVREDGEIVSDSRIFRIQHCLLNKVVLHFRHEQQYPSTEASMTLSASPSSVCGVGLVDKSVRFLKHKDHFRKENIFSVLEKYDVGQDYRPHQVSEDYCMQKQNIETTSEDSLLQTPDPRGDHQLYRSISYHVDASMAFERAGIVVISNFELETRPCVLSIPVAIEYVFDNDVAERVYYSPPVESKSPNSVTVKKPENRKTKVEEIRSYFPETWLWEMHTVGSSGQTVIKRQLPHTITQWVGGAVCVHPKTGLGLFEDSNITVFQPFFVSFQLPYSVIRGEVLPLVVSVFNYLTECLPIKLSLEPSDEFQTLSESRFHKMCVCGGESRSHRFVIKPTKLDKINITVYGFSLEEDDSVCGNEVTARFSARDAVSKQLLVEAEGLPKEEVFNYFVCPESMNGSFSTEVDMLLPEDVVEGSARAYVSVTGDVMGPALKGLSRLVRLPVGCGEQNMVLFTPNIFVLDYLTATNRVTDEIKNECLSNMRTGYQRELKYRHRDGSYSAFGESDDEGGMWLTAFVLRSFGQARRFVDIDENDLRLSTSWILEKQFENGCFESTGYLIHRAMKGGLIKSETSMAPLTAYVLIALLESKALRPEQPAVQSALMCLSTEQNPSTYTLALFAYASALAKETPKANLYLQQLDSKATIKGGQMHWKGGRHRVTEPLDVEIAGYYILSRIEVGGRDVVGDVLPVVKWMIQQRNTNGGYISTQDTVVALQALALYSALLSTSLDIGLVIESDELVKGFKLEDDNKLLTQTAQIPVLPTVVDLQAVGDGCALVQFSLRYNAGKIPAGEAFELGVEALRIGGPKCNLPRIGICIRYTIPNQVSNMVVVSVKLASGYMPDEQSLYALQSDESVQLKRHEVEGNFVNLYFNELSKYQKCFKFHIKSELEVDDLKPSSITVYDYYRPEFKTTQEYTIPSNCTDYEGQYSMIDIMSGNLIDDTDWIINRATPGELSTQQTVELSTQQTIETTTDALLVSSPMARNEVITDGFAPEGDIRTDTTDNGTEYMSLVYDGIEPNGSPVTLATNTEYYTSEQLNEAITVFSGLQSNDVDTDKIQTAAEATNFQSDGFEEDEHLTNFVNSYQYLDLPDGIEANLPVSVLPPSNTTPTTAKMNQLTTTNCPVCDDGFPDNFTNIYCNSAFVLRIVVINGTLSVVKIVEELSYFLPQLQTMKKIALLQYDKKCICPQLQEKGSIHLIVGTPADLWNSKHKAHTIRLTNQVYVISFPFLKVLPLEIYVSRDQCDIEP